MIALHPQTGTASVSSRAAAGGRRWTTPRRLKNARLFLLLLDAILMLVVTHAVELRRAELSTLKEQEMPALLAAYRLRTSLEAVQASAARQALGSDVREAAVQSPYQEERSAAVRSLLHAAEGTARDLRRESALETIALDLEVYERQEERSQELQKTSPGEARLLFEQANASMRHDLLPAGEALEEMEVDNLRKLQKEEQADRAQVNVLPELALAVTLFALLWAQVYLSRQSRRTFSPALLGATALLLLSTVAVSRNLSSMNMRVRSVQEDLASSLEHLLTIQQLAYARLATVDGESHAPAGARAQQALLDSQAATVATQPEGLRDDELIAALRESGHVDGFSGLLATEIATAPGGRQRDVLLQALASWQALVRETEGPQMRSNGAVPLPGRHATGSRMASFERSMGLATAAQEAAMEEALSDGTSLSERTAPLVVVVLASFAGLILLGFAPRLREYA